MANTHCVNLDDGSSQYLSITDHADFSPTSDFTVEMWARVDDITATMAVVNKSNAVGDQQSYFIVYNGAVDPKRFAINTSSDGEALTGATVNWTAVQDQWYHWAFVYDASDSEVEIFVDGLSIGTAAVTGSIFDATTPLHFGATQVPDKYFSGRMDEIRFWKGEERTQTQIRQHMGVDLNESDESLTNLTGYWKLDNDLTDSSGNSHTLTNNGTATFSTAVGFEYDTFWPDSNTESTSVDGYVGEDDGAACNTARSWADLIAVTSGNQPNYTNATFFPVDIQACGTGDTDQWRNIRRGITVFDTSAIPDTNAISAATLSLYITDKSDPLSITPDMCVYDSTLATDTEIVAGDFDQTGSTAFSSAITYASISTSAYNDFALNASGIAAIVKTGTSGFSIKNKNYDADAVAPTWSDAGESYVTSASSDGGNIEQSPKLVVTHSAVTSTTSSSSTTSTSTSTSSSTTTSSSSTSSSTTTTFSSSSTTSSSTTSSSSTSTSTSTSTSSSSTTTHFPFVIPELEILAFKPILEIGRSNPIAEIK